MISNSEHIGVRLSDIRCDGSGDCARDIDTVMRRQNAIDMLASGNTIDQIEKAIVALYRETLAKGAVLIAEVDPDDPQQHAGALDEFAQAFERDVLRQYESDFPRLNLKGLTFDQRLSALSPQIATVRDRVMGDFRFGMAGGRRMTRQPTNDYRVMFFGPVSGSPAIAPGGLINQAITPSDVGLRALAERLLTELGAATAAEADARQSAEAAKVELAKSTPDRPLVVKLLARAGKGLVSIGKTALAEFTKAAVTGYAREYGIIPPPDE